MRKSIGIAAVSAIGAVAVVAPVAALGVPTLLIISLVAVASLVVFSVLLLLNMRYAAYLALAAAAFTSSWTTLRALGGVGNISDLLLLLAAVLLIARRCARWDWRWEFGGLRELVLPVMLLVVAGIFSTFQAVDPAGSLLVTAKISLTLLLVPLVIAEAAGSAGAIRGLLYVFVAGAGATSLAALSDMFLRTQFQLQATGAGPLWGRYAGLTAHPNDLGLVASLGIAAGLGLFVTGSRRGAYNLLLTAVPLLLCAGGLVASASLTAVMTAGTAVLTVSVLVAAKKPLFLLGVGVALLLGLLVVGAIGLTDNGSLLFARLEAGPQNASSLAERLQTYAWAWQQIESSPLVGHGLDQVGQGTTELRSDQVEETRIHDQWVEIWYTGGALGLLALALYYVQFWRLRARVDALIAVPCTAMLAVWLVDTLSQPSIYSRFGMFGVLCLIGACALQSSQHTATDTGLAGPTLVYAGGPPPAPLPRAPRQQALAGEQVNMVASCGESQTETPKTADPLDSSGVDSGLQRGFSRVEAGLRSDDLPSEVTVSTQAGNLVRRLQGALIRLSVGLLALIAVALLLLDVAFVDRREVWPPPQAGADLPAAGRKSAL